MLDDVFAGDIRVDLAEIDIDRPLIYLYISY